MALSLTPRTEESSSDPDCWYGIRDTRVRKRVQDRLAQRARRQRLSGAQDAGSHDRSRSCKRRKEGAGALTEPSSLDRSPMTTALFVAIPPREEIPADKMALEIPQGVYSALFSNGIILGLTCATAVPNVSRPAPDAPASLQPTKLQREVVHTSWIDRFPFPAFRDNLISLEGLVNEEEFLFDLFSMESFEIRRGCASWDPAAWIIKRDFAKKWGKLFNESYGNHEVA